VNSRTSKFVKEIVRVKLKGKLLKKLAQWILSMALLSLPVSGMAAYQGGDVKDGGTISGTVKFKRHRSGAEEAGCEQGQRGLRKKRPKRIRPWWSAMVISRMP